MKIREFYEEYESRLDRLAKVNSILIEFKNFVGAVIEYEPKPHSEILKDIDKTMLWIKGEIEYSNQLMEDILSCKVHEVKEENFTEDE